MTPLEHVSYLAGLVAVGLLVWRAVQRPSRPPPDNVYSIREERRRRGLKAANQWSRP